MTSSYDAVESDFANFVAEDDAISRVIVEVARDIRFKVVGFLTNPDVEENIERTKKEFFEKNQGNGNESDEDNGNES